jgi:hypothetical protein
MSFFSFSCMYNYIENFRISNFHTCYVYSMIHTIKYHNSDTVQLKFADSSNAWDYIHIYRVVYTHF